MLNIFDWFRKRTPQGRTAAELYGSIVTLARAPALYRDLGVPDTPNGRYEMIAVHMFLALKALGTGGEGEILPGAKASAKAKAESETKESDTLARALVEHFVTDMDDSMRELAVGDLAVPKKVKKAAGGLRERVGDYDEAMASENPLADMTTAITAYVWPEGAGPEARPAALAQYVLDAANSVRLQANKLEGVSSPEVGGGAGQKGLSGEQL